MLKRWVLTTWGLEKSGDWDCLDATDIAASEIASVLDAKTKSYGPPNLIFGYGGETVAFEWFSDSDTKVVLKQKPCD